MNYDDIYGDPYGYNDWMISAPSRPGRSKRTIRRKGETIRQYEHRTLHIRYPVNEKEYARQVRKRRSAGAKRGAAHRSPRASYYTGEYTYGQRTALDKGTRAIHEMGIKRDDYEIGDMRALLKDAHWDEVCGHKRWMFDNKTLVKEFKKYQIEYQKMY